MVAQEGLVVVVIVHVEWGGGKKTGVKRGVSGREHEVGMGDEVWLDEALHHRQSSGV